MLSHYEQRELKRIEQWFEATEPELADGLSRCRRDGPAQEEIRGGVWMALFWAGLYLLAGLLVLAGAFTISFSLIGLGIVAFVATGTAHLTRRSELRRSRRSREADQ